MNHRILLSIALVSTLGLGATASQAHSLDKRGPLIVVEQSTSGPHDTRGENRHEHREVRREDRWESRRHRREMRAERRYENERRQRHWSRHHDHRPVGNRFYYNARGPEFLHGRYLPRELRNPQYVVVAPRSHRLQPPPRGYHWVQVGSDYVMAAIATGIIAQIVLNH